MQRSPGYSGFTFAIGVTPSTDREGTPEVIAEQAGRWRLQTSGQKGLRLEVLDQIIEAPALPAGQCSDVVVSSQFNFSPSQSKGNVSAIDLYINGVRAATVTKKMPALMTSGYANPTYIGMNPGGGDVFQGKLTRPLILNERVVPDKDGGQIGNGISGVPSICRAN